MHCQWEIKPPTLPLPLIGIASHRDRAITAENREKSQHTDFNEDVTNESNSEACT